MAYAYFTKCVSDWYREYAKGKGKKAEFITCDFFKNIIDDIRTGNSIVTAIDMSKHNLEKIDSYNIDFEQNFKNLNDFLSRNGNLKVRQILFILTKCSRWTSLNVIKTLKSPEFDHKIFMILEDLSLISIDQIIKQFNDYLSRLEYDLPVPLIIIECNSINSNTEEIYKLYKKFSEEIKHNKKKIIIIAQVEKINNIDNTTYLCQDDTSFEHMDKESRDSVIMNTYGIYTIYIQDKLINFNEFISEECAAKVFNNDNIDSLMKILEKKSIKFGNMDAFPPNNGFYKDRTFSLNRGAAMKNDQINSTDLYNLESITLKEKDLIAQKLFDKKVIILANDSGFGKSTELTSIAMNMKNLFPALWIVRVNLNDLDKPGKETYLGKIELTRQEKFDRGEVDVNFAIKFASKLVVPSDSSDLKLHRHLFKIGLCHGNPKIVILFDGFNEICPHHKVETTELMRALTKTQITQFWVASQPHEQKHLEKQFDSFTLVLNPLTKLDQETFLNDFWNINLKKSKYEEKQKYDERNFKEICDRLKDIESNLNSKSDDNLKKNIHGILKKNDLNSLKLAIDELNLHTYSKKVLEKFNEKRSKVRKPKNSTPMYRCICECWRKKFSTRTFKQ